MLRMNISNISRIIRSSMLNHTIRSCSTASDLVKIEEQKQDLLEKLKKELPKPYDGPERDLVNFPRRVRLIEPGRIRHILFPQEWLDFFYKKTGVTGFYVFGFGLINFLLSKEWYVIEEELSTGVALFIMFYYGTRKFGPSIRAYGEKLQKEELDKEYKMKEDAIATLEKGIAEEKKNIWRLEIGNILIEAKKENVQMQLEAEYRKRMMTAYTEVKKRLDYFYEMDVTKRKLEQKHMVDWIVQSVMKSITPQQEKDTLQKCISDLKMLSARAV